jgi:hypothetical protein
VLRRGFSRNPKNFGVSDGLRINKKQKQKHSVRKAKKKKQQAKAGYFSISRARARKAGILVPAGEVATCIPDALASMLNSMDGVTKVNVVREALPTSGGSYPSYAEACVFLESRGLTLRSRDDLCSNELALFNQTDGHFLIDLKIYITFTDGTTQIDDHCVAYDASRTETKYKRAARGCLIDNQETEPYFVEDTDRVDQQRARAVFTEGLYGAEEYVRQVRMPRVYEIVSI